jgi:hypothetical protein
MPRKKILRNAVRLHMDKRFQRIERAAAKAMHDAMVGVFRTAFNEWDDDPAAIFATCLGFLKSTGYALTALQHDLMTATDNPMLVEQFLRDALVAGQGVSVYRSFHRPKTKKKRRDAETGLAPIIRLPVHRKGPQ